MPRTPKYYNPLHRKFMFLQEHNATNFLSNTYELWGFFFCLQKPIFNTVTPVAAATVAPILATNSAPSATTTGKNQVTCRLTATCGWKPNRFSSTETRHFHAVHNCVYPKTGSAAHTQMTSSTIVTMTMSSHSHATAVTTSAIPVGKHNPFSTCVYNIQGCFSMHCESLQFWSLTILNQSRTIQTIFIHNYTLAFMKLWWAMLILTRSLPYPMKFIVKAMHQL